MVGWKSVAAFAILVAGIVGTFAVYTFGWRDASDSGPPHTYTVRQGDAIIVPAASTRCEASAEGGTPNLFCTRIEAGRYQVVFYSDSVLVWDLRLGPDGPPESCAWGG